MLYLLSPGGVSLVDAGGGNYRIWFSRTQEIAFLDKFLRSCMVNLKGGFSAEKWGYGSPDFPGCVGPDMCWQINWFCVLNFL